MKTSLIAALLLATYFKAPGQALLQSNMFTRSYPRSVVSDSLSKENRPVSEEERCKEWCKDKYCPENVANEVPCTYPQVYKMRHKICTHDWPKPLI